MSKLNNKETIITFRLTDEESELLKQLSRREGIDSSKYLRNIINNQKRAFTLSPDEITLLKNNFANLTRLGSNINQITYHMNKRALSEKGEGLTPEEVVDLGKLLKGTDVKLNQTKEQIVKLIKKAG